MNPPRRFLVRGVNWLGDAVMTTPSLLRLREAHPEASITLLTPEKLVDLWHGHPAVNAVRTFQPGESPWTVGSRLRAEGFDVALVLPNSPRSALECFLGRIPRRVGLERPWRNWLLTERVPVRPAARRMEKPSLQEIRERLAGTRSRVSLRPDAHHTLDYLSLAAHLGADPAPLAPRLVVSEQEIQRAREKYGIGSEFEWLGLNAGAEYGPAKRWAPERFAAVAKGVSARRKVRWMLFGGGKDGPVCETLARDVSGSVNLAGRTTLRELMALLAVCRVVLTNDTGPMHVAAALGVPVVVPFGSTSPELTGPGLVGDPRHRLLRVDVACAPCFLRECPIDFGCMTGIGVERVTEEVLAAMGPGGA